MLLYAVHSVHCNVLNMFVNKYGITGQQKEEDHKVCMAKKTTSSNEGRRNARLNGKQRGQRGDTQYIYIYIYI